LFGVTTPLFLLIPYLFLWLGIQPAVMRFAEFITVATPVGVVGAAMYLLVQRWLCDPETERGIHWRGLALKIACWPVFLAGTLLAVVRADVPYIPTAKEAVRGRFFRLAWPQLLLIVLYVVTVVRVLDVRVFGTGEGSLELSAEAVWGMIAFATVPVLASFGALVAAWQSRRRPATAPWDAIDVARIGGAGE
jgi:cellulose synthase (UDP-forming)